MLLLSAALHCLHFKTFIDNVFVGSSIMTKLTKWRSDNEDKKLHSSLLKSIKKYHKYTEKITVDHRKTTQFLMSYCKLSELYLIMHRAVKINDTNLYAYSFFELDGWFFSYSII